MKKHTKRYMVIFSMWGKSWTARNMTGLFDLKEFVHTETEFDTEAEWKEEVKLIEEVYADTPRPVEIEIPRDKWHTKTWSFEVESRFWGYMVLDFERERVLKVGRDGVFRFHQNGINRWGSEAISLKMLDELFRGDDEIPKGYVFDSGEYEGWLRYRWGDGKNAVKCGEPCKYRKKKYGKHQQFDEDEVAECEKEIQAELIQDDFNLKLEKETIADKAEKW